MTRELIKLEFLEMYLRMGSPDFPQWKKYPLGTSRDVRDNFLRSSTIVAGLLVPWLDGLSRLFFAALVPGADAWVHRDPREVLGLAREILPLLGVEALPPHS